MPARIVIAAFATLLLLAGAARADTLADIKARGTVLCGATPETVGFSAAEVNGKWVGLGAAFCHGLAAVIFSDPGKVEFVPLTPESRLSALIAHQVDILADLVPWTLAADDGHGIRFAGTMFYDGQGFLAGKASAARSARELAGSSVCVIAGSRAEADLREYFDANNIAATLLPVPDRETAAANYHVGSCGAVSAATSMLAGMRETMPVPTDNLLLPDIITKQPRALVVANGDDRWFDIVRWTFYGLLDAEELGVTQANVDEVLGSDNISVRRFLGVEGDFGASIGLNKDWAYQLIKGVGNYGDIFNREVGPDTPLKLTRGLNALWNRGGIQYAPPVR